MISLRVSVLVLLCNLLCYNVNNVSSFPGGAPLSTCGRMLPGHHGMDLRTLSPFKLIVTPNEERNLNVEMMSPDENHFKGFLIEARYDLNNENEAIGSWSTNVRKTKTLHCFDSPHSAVTHNLHDDEDDEDEDDEDEDDEDDKDHHKHHKHFHNISLTWFPPKDIADKTVYFIATIVKHYSEVYINVSTSYAWNDVEQVRTARRYHEWMDAFNTQNNLTHEMLKNETGHFNLNKDLNATTTTLMLDNKVNNMTMGHLVVDKIKRYYMSVVNPVESFNTTA